MLFQPLFTTFCVLLLGLLATSATIGVRPRVSGPDNTLKATIQTIKNTIQQPPIRDAASVTVLPRRSEHEDHDAIPGLHETTIDWREDGSESLRLEAEREAGFLPSSHRESHDPLPQFWPLFKICVVSAIVICILKIARDLRGSNKSKS